MTNRQLKIVQLRAKLRGTYDQATREEILAELGELVRLEAVYPGGHDGGEDDEE